MTASLRPQHVGDIALAAIADALSGVALRVEDRTATVRGVTLDSRSVQPGDLYAALPGARAHGADFVAQAVASGARAVLTDPAGVQRISTGVGAAAAREAARGLPPLLVADDPRAVLGEVSALVYGRPADDLTMIGITGTNGKTTTAHLLEGALRAAGRSTGLIGTIETRIGTQRVPSVRTTPEATQLHGLLAVMVERGCEVCCMEVSSHALDLHRVDGVRYDIAIFTNLSQDHLDFHGSMEAYFQAKA
ncbi:MAG: Mur ligase family protein, partial [Micrococcales bacterium]|nr:Mur ligase family protein [Micrococcales bacterium]